MWEAKHETTKCMEFGEDRDNLVTYHYPNLQSQFRFVVEISSSYRWDVLFFIKSEDIDRLGHSKNWSESNIDSFNQQPEEIPASSHNGSLETDELAIQFGEIGEPSVVITPKSITIRKKTSWVKLNKHLNKSLL